MRLFSVFDMFFFLLSFSCDVLDTEFIVSNKFSQPFATGEKMGRRGDLEKAIDVSAQFSAEEQHNYWDGFAHEFKWPKETPIPTIKQTIDQRFPNHVSDLLYDGIVNQMVQEQFGIASKVVPILQEYDKEYHLPIHNGLRIGFWRHFQTDFSYGVQEAQQYPETYHDALFEEFGWWIGHSSSKEPFQQYQTWKEKIPQPNHCIFLHGTLRGWMMHQLEQGENLRDISLSFLHLSECSSLGWRGLVWGAQIHYGHLAPEFTEWILWLQQEHPFEGAAVILQQLHSKLWE